MVLNVKPLDLYATNTNTDTDTYLQWKTNSIYTKLLVYELDSL